MSTSPLNANRLTLAGPTAGVEQSSAREDPLIDDEAKEEERGDSEHDQREMDEEKYAPAAAANAAAAVIDAAATDAAAAATNAAAANAAAAAAAPPRKRKHIPESDDEAKESDDASEDSVDARQLALEWTSTMSRQEGVSKEHMRLFAWWVEKIQGVESDLAHIIGAYSVDNMVPARAIGSAPLEQRSTSVNGVLEVEGVFERSVSLNREGWKRMQRMLVSLKHALMKDFDTCSKTKQIQMLHAAATSVKEKNGKRQQKTQQLLVEESMASPEKRARLQEKADAVEKVRREHSQGALPAAASAWDQQVASVSPMLMLRSPSASSHGMAAAAAAAAASPLPSSARSVATPPRGNMASQSRTTSQIKTPSQEKNNRMD